MICDEALGLTFHNYVVAANHIGHEEIVLTWLVCGSGALGGTLLGIVLCLIQQHFEIIKLGSGVSAQYVVSAYPVHLIWSDVLLTMVSVAVIGWIATAYTTRHKQY